MSEEIGFEVQMSQPYDEALELVIAALKSEGFGVLTSIDVKATLKEKLGEDFRPYVIIGACNPPLAHRALSTDASVGLMLPCNVTVEAKPDGGTLTRIADPIMMMQAGAFDSNPELNEVASQAHAKLKRVANSLQEQ